MDIDEKIMYWLEIADDSGFASLLNEDQKKHIDLLMPLNIETRYPDDKIELLKTLDSQKSKLIFKKTEDITAWIRKQIKK